MSSINALSSKISNPSGKIGMSLKFVDMNSNEYNRETEVISAKPGHFTMKANKIAMDEVKKAIRKASIKTIRIPKNIETGFKNRNTLKQLSIMERKTEDAVIVNKVRHEAKNFEKYIWLRLTGRENSVFRKPISLKCEIIK
ncbi:MAG: hypothetical protein QXN75_00390 [Thermoproteota archaeon]